MIIVATRQQARSMQYKSQPEATVIATTMLKQSQRKVENEKEQTLAVPARDKGWPF